MTEHILIGLGIVIVLGFAAQWLSWRVKIPSILFLLLSGIVAGPVLGFLNPNDLFGDVLIPFVSISVAVILFEGGLTLKISEFRKIGRVVSLLISIGLVVTWIVTTAGAHWLLGLSMPVSVLLGAVLSVTGPTVIGPLLRNIKPQKNVSNVLKWEGILIDPIGALMAILVFEVILIGEAQQALQAVLFSVARTILSGIVIGSSLAFLLAFLIKKFWIPDYLQGSAGLTFVVIGFLISNFLQAESGLLTATIMGIVLSNQTYASTKRIREFKEDLTLFIIPILFILLSARLDFENIKTFFTLKGALFMLVVILIGRPLSVFISTFRSSLTLREKLFISWVAPRGIVAAAVSSVFALRLLEINLDEIQFLVPVTFLVIIGTVIIYGFTSPLVARWLKVSQSDPQGILIAGGQDWALDIAAILQDKGFPVIIVDTNRQHIGRARMRGLTAVNDSIIADRTLEQLNLEGIGKLIALTSNDEVNSLSVLQFAEEFGKINLYQLVPNTNKDELEFSPLHLRGRYLFGKGINFDHISNKVMNGAAIKSTTLSDAFTFDDFRKQYNDAFALLFVIINKGKRLMPVSADEKIVPQTGNTIIALVDNP